MFVLLVFLVAQVGVPAAQPAGPRPYQGASVSQSEIAFSYAG
jgi:hypothetical protein